VSTYLAHGYTLVSNAIQDTEGNTVFIFTGHHVGKSRGARPPLRVIIEAKKILEKEGW